MSDIEIKTLQQEILNLEQDVKNVENILESMKEKLTKLKDIACSKEAKKESSSMYKVLQDEKPSTIVRSNKGKVKVDRAFMEKEIRKHLDDPKMRGMVTTEEMLSFSKVAKNIEPSTDKKTKELTWKAETNDGHKIIYGTKLYRDKNYNHTGYEVDDHLVTVHTKTEKNGRAEVDGRSHPHHPIFNDFDFRSSALSGIIPQKPANEVKNSEIPIIEVSKTQFEKIKKTFANLKSNKSKEKDIKR